jgi:GntR family transcriptional regulator
MSNERSRQVSRYGEIADYLRGLVAAARPGDRLPSEAEICESFDVSRMTARQAFQLVAADGRIERRRGAGTFVRAGHVTRDLGSPLSFSGSMMERGMETSSRTLEWGEVVPTEDERLHLALSDEENGYVLERVRLADGTPMAVERVVMPRHLALSLRTGFQDGSLHEAFRGVGRVPAEAHAEVRAQRANKRDRDLLGLGPSGLVISELRTIYDQDGLPLERTETRYAANRYTFRAVLREPRSQK